MTQLPKYYISCNVLMTSLFPNLVILQAVSTGCFWADVVHHNKLITAFEMDCIDNFCKNFIIKIMNM